MYHPPPPGVCPLPPPPPPPFFPFVTRMILLLFPFKFDSQLLRRMREAAEGIGPPYLFLGGVRESHRLPTCLLAHGGFSSRFVFSPPDASERATLLRECLAWGGGGGDDRVVRGVAGGGDDGVGVGGDDGIGVGGDNPAAVAEWLSLRMGGSTPRELARVGRSACAYALLRHMRAGSGSPGGGSPGGESPDPNSISTRLSDVELALQNERLAGAPLRPASTLGGESAWVSSDLVGGYAVPPSPPAALH